MYITALPIGPLGKHRMHHQAFRDAVSRRRNDTAGDSDALLMISGVLIGQQQLSGAPFDVISSAFVSSTSSNCAAHRSFPRTRDVGEHGPCIEPEPQTNIDLV